MVVSGPTLLEAQQAEATEATGQDSSPSLPLSLPLDDSQVPALVNRLAWPVILENVFQSMLEVVNTILVARLGAPAVAGLGGAVQLIMVISAAFFAVSVGTTVLVARYVGAGDMPSANRVVKQSVLLTVAMGAILATAGYLFAYPAVAMLGMEPEVARLGGDYFQVVTQMAVVFVGIVVLGAALRGAGDTRSPMMVTGLINVFNAGLAYLLIFGELGMPAMGVRGSGWAASVARGIGAAILLWMLIRGRSGVCIGGRDGWKPDLGLVRRLLKVGIPSLIENLLFSGGMLTYNLIVIGMGTTVFAALRITMNVVMMSIFPGFGFATAATTLTGQSLGAGRPALADRSTGYAVKAAVVWMSAMGVAFFLFGDPIMRAFTADPAIIGLGVTALQIVALAQPFHALALVYSGSLRGAGDTRFPMAITALCMWLVRVPTAYLLGVTMGFGLSGVYGSSIIDAMVRAGASWVRHRSGGWREIQV